MKYILNAISFFQKSLVAKLILSFVLVSVPPMLIASRVATAMIQSTLDKNLDAWLQTSVGFIIDAIESAEDELGAIYGLVSSHFLQESVILTEEELASLSNLDIDFILLKDDKGNILYQVGGAKSVEDSPIFLNSPLSWVTLENGEKKLAVVIKKVLHSENGEIRTLAFGTIFTISVSEEKKEPIEFRVFLPYNKGFKQVYSSKESSTFTLRENTIDAFKDKKQTFYTPETEQREGDSSARSIVYSVRDHHGEVQALYVVSALLLNKDTSLPSANTVFFGFFLFGTLLVSAIGYFVAKRLVLPLQKLTEGVKKVSSGDYSHSVAENRVDEVGELSRGFNLMARQLKVKQMENKQRSRQERSQMLGEIALGFAHEIRNPLVVIKTSAEVVHTRIKEREKESRLLGFVVEEVRRIDSLITEFLSFARPAVPIMEYFDLLLLVQEIIEISIPEFEKNNIAYLLMPPVSLEESSFFVLGERNQIRQVILNIILNAIDAMPQGGELSFFVFKKSGTDTVGLSIKDTGVGISDEILSSMYIPFMSTKKNGLGLGLAKVYAIMEEHSGSIFCESEVGKGSTFTLHLQCKP